MMEGLIARVDPEWPRLVIAHISDPIPLARMVNKVEWLRVENENQHDPINLVWMVKKVAWLRMAPDGKRAWGS